MTSFPRLPEHGSRIVFLAVPCGSWASEGVVYEVEREGRYVHLRNVVTGSGTSDQAWTYSRARWALAQG